METVYETALCHELLLRGIQSQRQLPIPVTYKDMQIRDPLYLNILVERQLIIEVKATGKDYPIYQTQLLTQIPVGILLNFGMDDLRDGVYFVRNGVK